ncbi:MAG: SIR2 family protein [Candidatus Aminicenantales bacterium]
MPDPSNAKGTHSGEYVVPADIINSVKSGKCILFLGAMASAPSPPGCKYVYDKCPPGGGQLSQRLAEEFSYPENDKTSLQRVSLFGEFGPLGSRNRLVEAVIREIARPEGEVPANFRMEPSPALRMLAALPFRVIITTNYDKLFDTALANAKTLSGLAKNPIVRIYDPTRNGPPEEVPDESGEENPILLKLHGDVGKYESLVITEEDYITFIQRMADTHLQPIHDYIRTKMRAWPFLFIGYSLKDYNLRLLFRTLRYGVDMSYIKPSFSVDPYPDNLVVAVWQRANPPMVNFIPEDLWKFVPALYRAVIGKEYQA